MPTYFIDFEGGNDANTGLSFAQRWKTFTNGATAARIAPGDNIRVMASPDPTLVGDGTWTNGPVSASQNIVLSTNTTPIVMTVTGHGLVTGDYVAQVGHTTNINANGVWRVGTVTANTYQILQMDGSNTVGNGIGAATGTARKVTNSIVRLASAATQNIALCGGIGQKLSWTSSASVATSKNTTDYKEGYSSASIAMMAGFTTGKAAYQALPAALNLSGFQQVSFWVKQTAGTIGAAGSVYIALCSDTSGNTVVNTVNIPAIGRLGVWNCFTVNLGANLGSNIQSVAFYVVTDNGAQTFLLDNIIACKAASSADSLTLSSLISKSDGTGDEAWYSIQSINSTAVMLANGTATISTDPPRGYMGTTETVATYKRQPIRQTPVAALTTVVNQFTDSGSSGNLISYSGGWDRTDMSTQTGETWYDGVSGDGYCYTGTTTFNRTDKLNAVRFNQGWRFTSANNTLLSGRFTGGTGTAIVGGTIMTGPIWANNNGGIGVSALVNGAVYGDVKSSSNNLGTSVDLSGVSFTNITSVDAAHNNVGAGLEFGGGSNNYVEFLRADGNTTFAIATSQGTNNRIGGGSSASSGTASANIANNGTIFLENFTMNDTVEFSSGVSGIPGGLFSNRHDGVDGNSWVFNFYGTINQQTAVVDAPATTAWRMNVTNSSASAAVPLRLKLATIVCGIGTATITARMRRSNSGLTMRLICPGGQIGGVLDDVFTDMTAAANTWETVTITFTTTKAGAVDIYAHAFGGSTNSGFVSNITASQD